MSPCRRQTSGSRRRKNVVNRLLEDRSIERVSSDEYRDKVRSVYAGPKGALLATCSFLSLHKPLGERLLRERKFDLHGCRQILDVGSGAGQIAGHLLKYADRDAQNHLPRSFARNAPPGAAKFEERLAAVCRGRFVAIAAGVGNVRLRHVRLCARAFARSADRAGGACPRDGAGRQDAAANDGRQFRRRMDEPDLVLPHLQSPGVDAHLPRAWA